VVVRWSQPILLRHRAQLEEPVLILFEAEAH
jgi:hypothetical protein